MTYMNGKLVVFKCTEVMELLKTFSIESMDLRQCFITFFIKTTAFDIYNLSVLWFHLSRSTNVLIAYPYLPIFLYTPVMAVRLNENIFYGGVSLLHTVFKQLNENLLEIVRTRKSSEVYRKILPVESDDLEKLEKLHFKLSEAMKAFNSIFDDHIGLWIILQLTGLIIRCFFQYIGIAHLLNSHANTKLFVMENVMNFGILFLM